MSMGLRYTSLILIQLEEQLASHPPPAKRARKTANDTTAPAEASSSTIHAPVASSSTKAEDKKRRLQLKKIFDRCLARVTHVPNRHP